MQYPGQKAHHFKHETDLKSMQVCGALVAIVSIFQEIIHEKSAVKVKKSSMNGAKL